MFGVVSRYIIVARHPFRKRVSWCIQSTSFCHRNHFFVFHNEHAQSTTLGLKLMFGVVFVQFRCRTSPIPKTGVGVHTKHESSQLEPFLRFRNEHAQSTTLGPKFILVWFRAISLSDVAHSQNGCLGAYKARLLPPAPILRFSQRTCPIHYFRSKTHVWCGFTLFRCRTSPIPKTSVGVHTKHEFLPPEPFLRFSQRTCPVHYFRSKTHVWGGFAQFRCRTSPIPNHFFAFCNEHAQSTTLGPKLMFGVVSRNFVAARHPLQKRVSGGVHTKHEFLPPETILRFSQLTCPIHYFRSKTHVWGDFVQFRCRTLPIPKTGVGVHTKHEFLPLEPFLRFSQRTCPIH
jgi:hypothetical protein